MNFSSLKVKNILFFSACGLIVSCVASHSEAEDKLAEPVPENPEAIVPKTNGEKIQPHHDSTPEGPAAPATSFDTTGYRDEPNPICRQQTYDDIKNSEHKYFFLKVDTDFSSQLDEIKNWKSFQGFYQHDTNTTSWFKYSKVCSQTRRTYQPKTNMYSERERGIRSFSGLYVQHEDECCQIQFRTKDGDAQFPVWLFDAKQVEQNPCLPETGEVKKLVCRIYLVDEINEMLNNEESKKEVRNLLEHRFKSQSPREEDSDSNPGTSLEKSGSNESSSRRQSLPPAVDLPKLALWTNQLLNNTISVERLNPEALQIITPAVLASEGRWRQRKAAAGQHELRD